MYRSFGQERRLNRVQAFLLSFLFFPVGPVFYGVYLLMRWARERREREESERRRVVAEHERRSSQQRREDARSECVLLYSLYAPEIAGRFPRKALDEYMQKYMNDNEEPGRVEARGAELRQVMQQHKDRAEPPERFASLGELTAWFEEQKKQLETCPDDRMRRSLLVQLKERYSELSAELLEQI
jgi:hypothetical protein